MRTRVVSGAIPTLYLQLLRFDPRPLKSSLTTHLAMHATAAPPARPPSLSPSGPRPNTSLCGAHSPLTTHHSPLTTHSAMQATTLLHPSQSPEVTPCLAHTRPSFPLIGLNPYPAQQQTHLHQSPGLIAHSAQSALHASTLPWPNSRRTSVRAQASLVTLPTLPCRPPPCPGPTAAAPPSEPRPAVVVVAAVTSALYARSSPAW